MLAVWVWIATDFTGWLFPFATGVRLWVLWLATPLCVVPLFRLALRGWRRARARLMATTPPPWPGRRELATLAVAAVVVTLVGLIPDEGVRRELAAPRYEGGDTLGYHYTLETRLGRWGAPYRVVIACRGPRPCTPLYSIGFTLEEPGTREVFEIERWDAPPSLSLPGGRFTKAYQFRSVDPAEYRRAKARLRLTASESAGL